MDVEERKKANEKCQNDKVYNTLDDLLSDMDKQKLAEVINNKENFKKIWRALKKEALKKELKKKDKELKKKDEELENYKKNSNAMSQMAYQNKNNRLLFKGPPSSSEAKKIKANHLPITFHPSILHAKKLYLGNQMNVPKEKIIDLMDRKLHKIKFEGKALKKNHELLFSSLLSTRLQDITSSSSSTSNIRKHFAHQFPLFYERDGRKDPNRCEILICEEDEERIVPTGIIEVGLGENLDKLGQTLAYVNLANHITNYNNTAFCCLEWILGDKDTDFGKFVGIHYFIATIIGNDAYTYTICKLKDPSEDQTQKIINSLIETSTHIFKGRDSSQKWENRGDNVAIDFESNRVYKIYDYSDRIPRYKRSPEHYETFLSSYNPKIEKVTDDFTILSYDLIEGSHRPTSTRHFLDLCLKLKEIHDKDLVHGDVRLLNFIFKDLAEILKSSKYISSSEIIDLDYLRNKNYPFYFNKVSDTVRHKDAIGGAKKKKIHDIYSLGQIFNFFEVDKSSPKNSDDIQVISTKTKNLSISNKEKEPKKKEKTQWEQMIGLLIDENNLEGAIEILQTSLKDLNITIKKDFENIYKDEKGTGSPTDNDQKKNDTEKD
eukprot:TRINITY_DN1242_c0_g1_i1.p1 TRINITY_DN1242_c0_g1~~TRINITY_DN1242_c0_g1_i1.p1  ORF type:complete len:666 (-),score=148.19 TRINITY_DN1242_c0_g1_i1:67-1878(-)